MSFQAYIDNIKAKTGKTPVFKNYSSHLKMRFMKNYSLLIILLISATLGCHSSKKVVEKPSVQNHIVIQKTAFAGNLGEITGSVRDFENGVLLDFISVIIQSEQKKPMGTTTNSEGNFSIANIPPGSYTLTFTGAGYSNSDTILVVEANTKYTLDVRLVERHVVLKKPIIYLYPTEKQNIHVKLNYNGTLTHTYPAYPENGWHVVAEPNGTLWDENGQEYYALFWEGIPSDPLIPKDGFVVSGKETVAFLEEKLAYLGLSRREANEFIMYWMPLMENNPYNFIHFSGEAYLALAELNITPEPETVIRVMMLTQPLKSKIDFPMQDLSPLKKTRKGFTVVEWGGTEINSINESL